MTRDRRGSLILRKCLESRLKCNAKELDLQYGKY